MSEIFRKNNRKAFKGVKATFMEVMGMSEQISIPLYNSQRMLELFLELSKNKLVNIIKYAHKARKEK